MKILLSPVQLNFDTKLSQQAVAQSFNNSFALFVFITDRIIYIFDLNSSCGDKPMHGYFPMNMYKKKP